MNKVYLIGRLVRDIELKEGKVKYVFITLAVDRYREGTDFIDCIAFGKTAEFLNNYAGKGDKVFVDGRLEIEKIKKESEYITNAKIIINNVELFSKKRREEVKENKNQVKEVDSLDEVKAIFEGTGEGDDSFPF